MPACFVNKKKKLANQKSANNFIGVYTPETSPPSYGLVEIVINILYV